ncbi:MAG: hypothetical protein H0W50_03010 [Parachlamydiaceae bacterium]|nr:hypothetical protein [Parachlamydiaceae bacterium]
MLKELDHETVFTLIAEARDFIAMTEHPTVKSALNGSDNPIALTYQLLDFAFKQLNRFPMLKATHSPADESFCQKTSYMLTQVIEAAVCSSLT